MNKLNINFFNDNNQDFIRIKIVGSKDEVVDFVSAKHQELYAKEWQEYKQQQNPQPTKKKSKPGNNHAKEINDQLYTTQTI